MIDWSHFQAMLRQSITVAGCDRTVLLHPGIKEGEVEGVEDRIYPSETLPQGPLPPTSPCLLILTSILLILSNYVYTGGLIPS